MTLRNLMIALAAATSLFAATAPLRADTAVDEQRNVAADAQYCIAQGGVVQTRIPYYGTNNPNALKLAGSAEFCQFTKKKGGSQINILLTTLGTAKPTLAAMAYYAKVQLGSCSGNPASCYCTLLGGSDSFGGVNLGGGGWVLKTDHTDVLEACIFPDLSSIDSWGLTYHSNGIIRGKNLADVLKFPNPYKKSRSFIPRKDNALPFQ